MKNLLKILWIGQLFFILYAQSNITRADATNPFGQTIQIHTNFDGIVGYPSWLIIVRDENGQQVVPYQFQMRNNQNFYIVLTWAHTYRITASNLSFGHYANVDNYCHLQDGILSGKSMLIELGGVLSPDRSTSRCRVQQYQDMPFPVVP